MGLYLDGFLIALKGVPVTVGVSLIAVALGVCLGLGIALMKMSKHWILRIPATIYVEIVRGTPIVVQAFIFAYGIPQLLQTNGVPFKWPYLIIPAIMVCSLNSAAYVAEVIRRGLQAVDKGQMEASRSMGLSYAQTMRLVILPQALRVMLPSIINQFIVTLKDTSLLSAIGLRELTQNTKIIVANNMEALTMYFICGVWYWVVIFILTRASRAVEKRTKYGR